MDKREIKSKFMMIDHKDARENKNIKFLIYAIFTIIAAFFNQLNNTTKKEVPSKFNTYL